MTGPEFIGGIIGGALATWLAIFFDKTTKQIDKERREKEKAKTDAEVEKANEKIDSNNSGLSDSEIIRRSINDDSAG